MNNENTVNKNIIRLSRIFIVMFLSLIIMNSYWAIWREKDLTSMVQNPRNREKLNLRGKILGRDGTVFARSEKKKRLYPQEELTSHITGYLSPLLGKTGLEDTCDDILRSHAFPFSIEGFKERWLEGHPKGYNIYLTIDSNLTKVAYDALGNNRGAVVAIKPQTGEILVMVTKPGFDNNNLEKNWKVYQKDSNYPLLDRTVQGSYAPGSIFKVLILCAALQEGVVKESDTFDCPGYTDIDGHRFHCSHTHGHQTLRQALSNSCNVAFSSIGLKLGKENLLKYFDDFFGHYYNIKLPVLHSKLTEKNLFSNTLIAQTSFGQGELAITPFEACLIASAVANKGKIMYPLLIKEIRDSKNRIIEKKESHVMAECISTKTAETVASMMEAVVTEGTGYRAYIEGIPVAGKTGTAEHPGGANNAWFIGFAPVENPEIAVAVIVEEGGTGGESAAPIAGEVMKSYLENK
jgi:peptidoglycan glycosyltransferase